MSELSLYNKSGPLSSYSESWRWLPLVTLNAAPSDLRFNTRRNLQYILELMASGTMDLGPIISHRLPATKMRYAYELAVKHSKELVAAIFKWEGSE